MKSLDKAHPAEGKIHTAINADLALRDDRPPQESHQNHVTGLVNGIAGPTKRQRATAEGIVRRVIPLICLSREEIVRVDPWFDPDRVRYRESLEALLAASHADGRTYDRLEYHVKVRVDQRKPTQEKSKWIAQFKRNCLDLLPKHISIGVELKMILWCDAKEVMHARYVLTERGGIQINKKLDCGNPGETTDVHLMPCPQFPCPDSAGMMVLHRWRWGRFCFNEGQVS